MTRKRLLRGILSSVFLLFLVLLAVRFRPRVEMPAPLKSDALSRGAEGTLTAQGVTQVQETSGKVDFRLESREVTEAGEGRRRLKDPVVVFPARGKAWGREGEYDPARKTLRIWNEARLSDGKDLAAAAEGFRLTPEGEVVSEGPVALSRPGGEGRADLLRYFREAGKAHLEGNVFLKTGKASLTAAAVDVDLDGHGGVLQGPVAVEAPEGRVEAPSGRLLLDANNELKEVVLGPPASGKGPRGAFTAREAAVELDSSGAVQRIRLEGEVRLTQEGKETSTVETARLLLRPAPGGTWTWEAPEALRASRGDAVALSPRGTGSFGGSAEPEALLAGPVTGRDAGGTFSGDEATLRGADWTLRGHARSERGGDTLEAEEITAKGDGSTLARGEVKGRRKAAQGPDTLFTTDEAAAAAGGYPAELHGRARVERGGMVLLAPHVHVEDAQTALAVDGEGRFTDEKGRGHTVRGAEILYLGKAHRAEARGKASAEGEGYRVEADLLTALLDEGNRPSRYEGQGECRFTGPEREGKADRMAYDPATGKGTAWGEKAPAVVIQREPRRRAEGYEVVFGPGTLEVLPGHEVLGRGRLRGVPPPSAKAGGEREGRGK